MGKRRYSEAELRQFETQWSVTLPIAYRRYLKVVGCNGSPGLMILEDWYSPYELEGMPAEFLSWEFPHRAPWNDLTLRELSRHDERHYHSSHWWRGAMRIRNTGCESYAFSSCRDRVPARSGTTRASALGAGFSRWSVRS